MRKMLTLSISLSFVASLLSGALSVPAHAQAPAAPPPDDGYVDVPGARVHRSCLVKVPNGASIGADGRFSTDGFNFTKPRPCKFPAKFGGKHPRAAFGESAGGARTARPSAVASPSDLRTAASGRDEQSPPPPDVNGWLEWNGAWAPAGRAYAHIHNRWEVPWKPLTDGALIYLFNGLQDATGSVILQPVLQYGVSPAGGGNKWSVGAWYVQGGGHAFYSDLLDVNPGDIVDGYVSGTQCSSSGFCYWIVDVWANGQLRRLHLNPGKVFTWATKGALEVYSMDTCMDLPNSNSVTFSATDIFLVNNTTADWEQIPANSLNWIPVVTPGLSPTCNYRVEDTADGTTLRW